MKYLIVNTKAIVFEYKVYYIQTWIVALETIFEKIDYFWARYGILKIYRFKNVTVRITCGENIAIMWLLRIFCRL